MKSQPVAKIDVSLYWMMDGRRKGGRNEGRKEGLGRTPDEFTAFR